MTATKKMSSRQTQIIKNLVNLCVKSSISMVDFKVEKLKNGQYNFTPHKKFLLSDFSLTKVEYDYFKKNLPPF